MRFNIQNIQSIVISNQNLQIVHITVYIMDFRHKNTPGTYNIWKCKAIIQVLDDIYYFVCIILQTIDYFLTLLANSRLKSRVCASYFIKEMHIPT